MNYEKAFDIIKQQDPETCITIHTILVWCKENKIPGAEQDVPGVSLQV